MEINLPIWTAGAVVFSTIVNGLTIPLRGYSGSNFELNSREVANIKLDSEVVVEASSRFSALPNYEPQNSSYPIPYNHVLSQERIENIVAQKSLSDKVAYWYWSALSKDYKQDKPESEQQSNSTSIQGTLEKRETQVSEFESATRVVITEPSRTIELDIFPSATEEIIREPSKTVEINVYPSATEATINEPDKTAVIGIYPSATLSNGQPITAIPTEVSLIIPPISDSSISSATITTTSPTSATTESSLTITSSPSTTISISTTSLPSTTILTPTSTVSTIPTATPSLPPSIPHAVTEEDDKAIRSGMDQLMVQVAGVSSHVIIPGAFTYWASTIPDTPENQIKRNALITTGEVLGDITQLILSGEQAGVSVAVPLIVVGRVSKTISLALGPLGLANTVNLLTQIGQGFQNPGSFKKTILMNIPAAWLTKVLATGLLVGIAYALKNPEEFQGYCKLMVEKHGFEILKGDAAEIDNRYAANIRKRAQYLNVAGWFAGNSTTPTIVEHETDDDHPPALPATTPTVAQDPSMLGADLSRDRDSRATDRSSGPIIPDSTIAALQAPLKFRVEDRKGLLEIMGDPDDKKDQITATIETEAFDDSGMPRTPLSMPASAAFRESRFTPLDAYEETETREEAAPLIPDLSTSIADIPFPSDGTQHEQNSWHVRFQSTLRFYELILEHEENPVLNPDPDPWEIQHKGFQAWLSTHPRYRDTVPSNVQITPRLQYLFNNPPNAPSTSTATLATRTMPRGHYRVLTEGADNLDEAEEQETAPEVELASSVAAPTESSPTSLREFRNYLYGWGNWATSFLPSLPITSAPSSSTPPSDIEEPDPFAELSVQEIMGRFNGDKNKIEEAWTKFELAQHEQQMRKKGKKNLVEYDEPIAELKKDQGPDEDGDDPSPEFGKRAATYPLTNIKQGTTRETRTTTFNSGQPSQGDLQEESLTPNTPIVTSSIDPSRLKKSKKQGTRFPGIPIRQTLSNLLSPKSSSKEPQTTTPIYKPYKGPSAAEIEQLRRPENLIIELFKTPLASLTEGAKRFEEIYNVVRDHDGIAPIKEDDATYRKTIAGLQGIGSDQVPDGQPQPVIRKITTGLQGVSNILHSATQQAKAVKNDSTYLRIEQFLNRLNVEAEEILDRPIGHTKLSQYGDKLSTLNKKDADIDWKSLDEGFTKVEEDLNKYIAKLTEAKEHIQKVVKDPQNYSLPGETAGQTFEAVDESPIQVSGDDWNRTDLKNIEDKYGKERVTALKKYEARPNVERFFRGEGWHQGEENDAYMLDDETDGLIHISARSHQLSEEMLAYKMDLGNQKSAGRFTIKTNKVEYVLEGSKAIASSSAQQEKDGRRETPLVEQDSAYRSEHDSGLNREETAAKDSAGKAPAVSDEELKEKKKVVRVSKEAQLVNPVPDLFKNAIEVRDVIVTAIREGNIQTLLDYSGGKTGGKPGDSEGGIREHFARLRLAFKHLEKIKQSSEESGKIKLGVEETESIEHALELANSKIGGIKLVDWCVQSTWNKILEFNRSKVVLSNSSSSVDQMFQGLYFLLQTEKKTIGPLKTTDKDHPLIKFIESTKTSHEFGDKTLVDTPEKALYNRLGHPDSHFDETQLDSAHEKILAKCRESFQLIQEFFDRHEFIRILEATSHSPEQGNATLENTLKSKTILAESSVPQFKECWEQVFDQALPELHKLAQNLKNSLPENIMSDQTEVELPSIPSIFWDAQTIEATTTFIREHESKIILASMDMSTEEEAALAAVKSSGTVQNHVEHWDPAELPDISTATQIIEPKDNREGAIFKFRDKLLYISKPAIEDKLALGNKTAGNKEIVTRVESMKSLSRKQSSSLLEKAKTLTGSSKSGSKPGSWRI